MYAMTSWVMKRPGRVCLTLAIVMMFVFFYNYKTDSNQPFKESFRSSDAVLQKPRSKATKTKYRYDSLNWLSEGYVPQTKIREVSKDEMPSFRREDIIKKYPTLNVGNVEKHDKWIILTTIQAPTEDVKFLAQLEGWKIVVVGDTKTPPDWSWKNCHFLSVEFQEKMGLQLMPLLSYKSYHRKNAGFIYAIAHGATTIYETDDDNRPTDKLLSFHYENKISGLVFGGSRYFNAYQYFGQSTLWQRGYPLAKVGAEVEYSFSVARDWPVPAIQQGVVNGDPDMDGLFRLTRKLSNDRLEVTFDPAGPPVILPPGVFSPYNTQNTLLHRSAFWSLYIPISINFRTCDIWRGYLTQRLMWELGDYLAFYPPNAYQQRNSHDLMDDTAQENEMYFTTEELLETLYDWECPEHLTFFQCQYKLMSDLVKKGNVILGEKDILGVKKWIEDIIMLGYEEPKRVKFNKPNVKKGKRLESLKSDLLAKGTSVFFAAAEQKEPTISWQPSEELSPGWKYTTAIASFCPDLKSFSTKFVSRRENVYGLFKDVLLVIYYPSQKFNNVLNLESYYRYMFPNIAYCGRDRQQFRRVTSAMKLKNRLTFIEIGESFAADHVCTAKAMQMNYKVSGYLTIRDDILLFLPSMVGLKKNTIWIDSNVAKTGNANSGAPGDDGTVKKALDDLGNSNKKPQGHDIFVANQKNFGSSYISTKSLFYIPSRLQKSAEFYLSYFGQRKIASDIAVPAVLRGIDDPGRFRSLPENDFYLSQATSIKGRVCDVLRKEELQATKAPEKAPEKTSEKNPEKTPEIKNAPATNQK